MKTLKILFLVNGPVGSAEALRAEAFSSRVPNNWRIEIQYRSKHKVLSVPRFLAAVARQRPDIIYVMKCAFTGVIAASIGRLVGCRFICDTGDAVYELAESVGTYSHVQLKLIKIMEYIGLHCSDAVVVRGSYHKKILEDRGCKKVAFIPDGVTRQKLVLDTELAHLKYDLKVERRFVVGIVGSMEWSPRHEFCYGWDLIEAMVFLRDLPLLMLFVGDGDGRAHLESRALELHVGDRVRFVGTQPYAKLASYLATMHVCVSTQSADTAGMVRTTGKLPLYLANGKHVIASSSGEACRVLPGIGSVLPYVGVRDDNHPKRLADEIRRLHDHPECICLPSEANRIAFEEFDYDKLSLRVQNLCESIMRPQSRPSHDRR